MNDPKIAFRLTDNPEPYSAATVELFVCDALQSFDLLLKENVDTLSVDELKIQVLKALASGLRKAADQIDPPSD